MRKILLLQWFDCKDAARERELVGCIEHNLKLDFDDVVIFNHSVKPGFFGARIKNVQAHRRLTYLDFVEMANDPANFNSLICLTNTDIKLDENLPQIVLRALKPKQLFCFSRYEADGRLAEFPWCTQDTWAILSQPIPETIMWQSSIPLGLPGCENRFAEIFFSAGFAVLNPCLDIKNVHVQLTKSVHEDEKRVFGAYLFVPACKIDDGNRNAVFPIPVYLLKGADRVFKIAL